MPATIKYLRAIKKPFRVADFTQPKGTCSACGEKQAIFQYFDVISNQLAEEWQISKRLQKSYSIRESMHCSRCRCSTRLRMLAAVISEVYGDGSKSLKENILDKSIPDGINVAEVNACGDLHEILKGFKKLHYSEYGNRAIGVPDEDLQSLSYKDNTFDLVLTSDTIEHIPDHVKALSEIHRVLKTGGRHIFTLPLIFSRKTKKRVKVHNNEIINLMKPSYHGAGEEDNLVIHEFGIDFLEDLQQAGFLTDIYYGNPINKNEVNYVLVSRKQ